MWVAAPRIEKAKAAESMATATGTSAHEIRLEVVRAYHSIFSAVAVGVAAQ